MWTFVVATDPTFRNDLRLDELPDPCADGSALRVKAERCRRLAAGISDSRATEVLNGMARNYQEAADRLNEQPSKA